MDELSGLIEELQKEVTELERALRLREAEEAAKLRLEGERLSAAEARLARARATLTADTASLAIFEEKRNHLLARTQGWRAELWKIAHGSAVMVSGVMIVTALPLAQRWLRGDWGIKLIGAQLALGLVLFFVIPKKR